MIKRTAPLLAALLMGAAGLAMAQGNPPNTSSPNPATGAGQQTQQGTPMGATGTPTPSTGSAPMNSGATTTTPAQSPDTMSTPAMRPARADRN